MSTTMESATTEVTTKEGVEIKGKDVIKLTAPEILPPAGQLLTNAQDIVGAINELFTSGTGATYNGNFRAVIDNNSGAITIVVGEIPEDMEEEQYCDYLYGYTYVDWSDEIITNTTMADDTTVKNTQTFTKRIITQLYTDSGEVLLNAEYNEKTGEITRYSDGADIDIHVAEWRTEPVAISTQSEGAKSAAIAWCIARNLEQLNSLTMQKKAYKNGLKKGIEGGADITEQYEQNTTTLNITPDGTDGSVGEPFIGDLTDGIYYTDATGAYVKMWLDMSYQIGSGDDIRTGRMVYEAYDANGVLLDTKRTTGSGNWAWKSTQYNEHVTNVKINGSSVTCTHAQTISGKTRYYNMDWSVSSTTINDIMRNAVTVGNIPPEIIT